MPHCDGGHEPRPHHSTRFWLREPPGTPLRRLMRAPFKRSEGVVS
jgi:hypothetical protein